MKRMEERGGERCSKIETNGRVREEENAVLRLKRMEEKLTHDKHDRYVR